MSFITLLILMAAGFVMLKHPGFAVFVLGSAGLVFGYAAWFMFWGQYR